MDRDYPETRSDLVKYIGMGIWELRARSGYALAEVVGAFRNQPLPAWNELTKEERDEWRGYGLTRNDRTEEETQVIEEFERRDSERLASLLTDERLVTIPLYDGFRWIAVLGRKAAGGPFVHTIEPDTVHDAPPYRNASYTLEEAKAVHAALGAAIAYLEGQEQEGRGRA